MVGFHKEEDGFNAGVDCLLRKVYEASPAGHSPHEDTAGSHGQAERDTVQGLTVPEGIGGNEVSASRSEVEANQVVTAPKLDESSAWQEEKRIADVQGTSAFRASAEGSTTSYVPKGLLLRPRAEGKAALLSIDGGGIRAVIPARILMRLEKILQEKSGEPDAHLCDFFDLLAGTSAGGCLVSMLAVPGKGGTRPAWSAEDVYTFWAQSAPQIFHHKLPRWMLALKNIWRPLYNASNFERLLDRVVGSLGKAVGKSPLTIADSVRPVLVTSFDILGCAPHFFDSTDARSDPKANFRTQDVCRATSAAPTVFRPMRLRSMDGSRELVCVDGGVVANNPTMHCLLHAVMHTEDFPLLPEQARRTIKDFYVLSLGSGEHTQARSYDMAKKWGLMNWASPLMDMMVWGNGRTVHSQISMLCTLEDCQKNYIRIEVNELPKIAMRMDNASAKNIKCLHELADQVLQEKVERMTKMGSDVVQSEETNMDRLLWLADRLIEERRARMEAFDPEK